MQPDADWIGKLQQAVEAAAGEVRGTFFYYAAFGLYFAVAVAGTADEDLLRGATVTMPGLGIGLPIVGFYVVVPALFVVFHVYALLQLVVLARRVGALQRALRRQPRAVLRQRLLVSPFAFSQRLFGEPPGLVQQVLLRLSIWLTLVLLPLGLLLATQVRFLPYHAEGVTLAHRLYIALDALLLLLLWPVIIHPGQRGPVHRLGALARRFARRRRSLLAGARAAAEAARRRQFHRRRQAGPPRRRWRSSGRAAGDLVRLSLALLVLFAAFVVATIPGEALERTLLTEGEPDDRAACRSVWSVYHWLDTVRLADGRDILCATWRFFEAPEAPFGLRRNMLVRDADLVLVEPSREDVADLGVNKAWQSKGEGIDLRGRDLRFADLSGSNLGRADLRGANLEGALLARVKLVAARLGDILKSEISECVQGLQTLDGEGREYCSTQLRGSDLSSADLQGVEGWKAQLQSADLTGANLSDARLNNSGLTGAILQWARLEGAQLRGADLRAAVMLGIAAPRVNLICADLQGALLKDATLQQSEAFGANLQAADLRGSDVDQALLNATPDCDPTTGAVRKASLALANLRLPQIGSDVAFAGLPMLRFFEEDVLDLERLKIEEVTGAEQAQVYELLLAKTLSELACSKDEANPQAGPNVSLSRGIVQRMLVEHRHADDLTPQPNDIPVRDVYFLVAGFFLTGACHSAAEPVESAAIRDTLNDADIRDLQGLRCLWFQQQSPADYRTLKETWTKLPTADPADLPLDPEAASGPIAEVLEQDTSEEQQRCAK